MTRVLFVQDVLYESFGPLVLSAVLKRRGHDCDLKVLAADRRSGVLEAIDSFRPQVLAFSISSFGYRWAVDLAREVKERSDVLTVVGGPHPTYFPEVVREAGIDLGCRGEGELALADLADAVDAGRDPREIPNLTYVGEAGEVVQNPLRPLIEDLDQLPFADRSLLFRHPALGKLSYKRFMVGRGCPYGCTYCFNRAAQKMYRGLGRYVRHRSPDNVIAEIEEVRRRWGLATVGFIDDTFTTDKRWLLAFLDRYRAEIGVPFTCLTRVNEVDEEVAGALAAAGCHYVSFGLEVGNERIRTEVLKRRMSDAEIRAKAALLHRAGIPFLTFNMFGVPGETAEDGLRTVRLNADIGTDLVGTSVFTPLHGTDIYDTSLREGLLEPSGTRREEDRITRASPLRQTADLRFLVRLQKIAFLGVHFPSLIPLLAILGRLPLGGIYGVLYRISLFLRYKVRFRLSTFEVVRLGLGSRGRFG